MLITIEEYQHGGNEAPWKTRRKITLRRQPAQAGAGGVPIREACWEDFLLLSLEFRNYESSEAAYTNTRRRESVVTVLGQPSPSPRG